MLLYPVFSAIAASVKLVNQRAILRRFRLRSRDYVSSNFLGIVNLMTHFLPFFWQDLSGLLDGRILGLFLIVAAIGVVASPLPHARSSPEREAGKTPASRRDCAGPSPLHRGCLRSRR